MQPHISLIIPVHNAEPFLDRCLESAAQQTEPALEIICVDDASTDASPAMLDARAAADNRFRIVHRQVNGGESAARNHGVALARGEYLAFLDHDDMLEPDACRLLYEAARATDADMVRGRVRTIDYEGNASLSPLELHRDIQEISRFYFTIDWWSAIYRASMVQGKLRFPEEYLLGGDMIFLTEALLATPRIQCISDLVYTHFLLPDSGASLMLSTEKVQSTIASRMRIIDLLRKANLASVDKSGYLSKMEQCFENILHILCHRCIDSASRERCCDALYTIIKLHRYPQEFTIFLQKTGFFFYFFRQDNPQILRNLVRKHDGLSSSAFLAELRRTALRHIARDVLAGKVRRAPA